jgi:hypothetical protein
MPIEEKRRGSSEPITPAPTMVSAVLTSGGSTRQGIGACFAGDSCDAAPEVTAG